MAQLPIIIKQIPPCNCSLWCGNRTPPLPLCGNGPCDRVGNTACSLPISLNFPPFPANLSARNSPTEKAQKVRL